MAENHLKYSISVIVGQKRRNEMSDIKSKDNKSKNGIDTINSVNWFDRWLFETRLYETKSESFWRFFLWFSTWGIGIYSFYVIKNPFAAIPNYILMAGAFLEDVMYNKLNEDSLEKYRLTSKICNAFLFLISLIIVIMSGVQLFEYYVTRSIRDVDYYNIIFLLGLVLVAKPLMDLLLMICFTGSLHVEYKSQKIDKMAGSSEFKIDQKFLKILQAAAASGPLTNNDEEE